MEEVGEYLTSEVIPNSRPNFAFNYLLDPLIYCSIWKPEMHGALCPLTCLTKNKFELDSKFT